MAKERSELSKMVIRSSSGKEKDKLTIKKISYTKSIFTSNKGGTYVTVGVCLLAKHLEKL